MAGPVLVVDASRLIVLFAAAGTATASALAIRGWIKRPLKQLQSHSEFIPFKGYESGKTGANAASFLPALPAPSVAAGAPPRSVEDAPAESGIDALSLIRQAGLGAHKQAREITIHYQKASGETSERVLTAYSRNLVEGRTHSINCRQAGERITKLFLLSGIQSLSVLVNAQSITVQSAAEIEALLDELLPLKGEVGPRRSNEDKSTRDAGIELGTAPEPASTAHVATELARMPPPPPPPPPPVAEPVQQKDKTLADLLPADARGFAILDLETTGKESGSCRIVEIALIKLDVSGRVTEQWETLVNPGCSFDNHTIHGISEAMASAAPTFDAIAPLLAAKLDGHVLVAHNLHRFDGLILERHFKEVPEISIDLGRGIDTMPNPRRKLSVLCDQHGVTYDPNDCHTALGDVRALSALVPKLLPVLSPASQQVVCASNPQLVNQVSQGFTRSLALASGLGPVARQAPAPAPQAQPSRNGGWSAVAITLRPGQVFVGTQNKAPSKLAVLQQTEDHLLALGLKLMAKRARIIASDLPDFVLAPSLEVISTKMQDAIRLNVPVVLCSDARQGQAGGTLTAWLKDG